MNNRFEVKSRDCKVLSMSKKVAYGCSVMAVDNYRRKGVNPYVVFLDNNVIKNRVGSWYIGLRQLAEAEHDVYNDANPPPAPAAFTGRLTSNFTLITYTSGCYYCQPTDNHWSSAGCKVCNLLTADEAAAADTDALQLPIDYCCPIIILLFLSLIHI